MAKKKTTRKELLKSPDEFMTFSERAINFYGTHRRQVHSVATAIGVLVLVYLGVNTYTRYVNKKGQTAYNEAYYAHIKSANEKQGMAGLLESEALFEKVMTEYGSSKAARLAIPQVAFSKFVQKDYDGAITHYEEFLDTLSADSPYRSLAVLALAASYEEKGETKRAIEILVPLLKGRDDPFKEPAMLSLARLYRIDNQLEKEKEVLTRFMEEYGDSDFVAMAKARLQ